MSLILYNAGIMAYGVGARLAAPFHKKAALWVKGQDNLLDRIGAAMKGNKKRVAWFHCASLGEFEQGRPLIEAFKEKYPKYKIVLTFFSPSGYEVRKNYAGADFVFYLPLDTADNAKKFVARVRPKVAFFIKYEFWHHYTKELKKRHIPFFSVSTIFRPNQIYFRSGGSFYCRILKRFSYFFTQNQESAELLAGIDINKVTLAGDTRMDRVLQTAANAAPIPLVDAFTLDRPVMVVGSSWPEDMKILLPFIQKHLDQVKFIIAPHEIKDKELQELEQQLAGKAIRFSQASSEKVGSFEVLLIDNIGMLSALYQYADYAYVGGAFGKGLHNTLEPAVFGPPLFFGPKYQKFQEALDLVEIGAAFPVKSTQELEATFNTLFNKPKQRAKIKENVTHYIHKQAGATGRILEALETWVPTPTT
ncbi:3-deoxy-D-manno-octulosonic acid transferase [Nibribacter ruber]|uniref:3-deoxy-D-manno-octulosonic acid transferase n=1 Tax=Nibribacter ruber TaxID=2698458 RepID=A0A6P1NZ78_9BACT|nr:glycosyltransferase N-terminal domain-containing protein [Nibribacter ruber]QHL87288.1 3-deoxy-D-manno-octulosonic acid transferase [Nibribacter ruber]